MTKSRALSELSEAKAELSGKIVRRNLMKASRKTKLEFSESNFLMKSA
ncbi:hypothetical protein [Aequitasia blattaphilus]|uniref:Uncharacterized protein n=1 Tax=Aequitasia blattaphilus TaxID=2949332 RepID=A0ABT1E8T1_9FIRM|nr:hypothetical protein [Aequitasia blattaphilus]MCP1102238.1 hypothetical protein [Aequitasia blattaphilus]MCR8614878.1 hypothetical protein [Aequitasia blattaphilus]